MLNNRNSQSEWCVDIIAARQDRKPIVIGLLVVLIGGLFFCQPVSAAPPTPAEVTAARKSLRTAGQLYREQKYDASAAELLKLRRQVQTWSLPRDVRSRQQVRQILTSMNQAAAALSRHGVTFADPAATNPARDQRQRKRGRTLASSPQATQPTAATAPATEAKTVSFAREIAPVIAANCLDCHRQDDRSGGLSLHSYAALQRGGNRGPILASAARDSLLVQKLHGTADGERMPLSADPLPASAIQLIETWIAGGAKFDAVTVDQPLMELAAQAKLASASAAELNDVRHQQAAANWRLAFPSKTFRTQQTDHFLVVADVGEQQLSELAGELEQAWQQVRRSLNLDVNQFEPRGRISVFVVERLYDLSEFSLLVEDRRLGRPPEDFVWNTNGTDAYLAVALPSYAGRSSESPLPAGVAAIWIQATVPAGTPRWFIQAVSDSVGLQETPAHPAIEQLAREMDDAVKQLSQPDDFMTGRTTARTARAAAASFIQYLIRSERQFGQLLTELHGGAPLETAFARAFSRTPAQLAADWQHQRLGRGASR